MGKEESQSDMSNNQVERGREFKLLYDDYVQDYKSYLQFRGFGYHHDDWFFVKRGFIACWYAPGFHRFWHTWNPGIGYFTYRLYLWLNGIGLGGERKRSLAILLTFLINGIIHNLVAMIILWRCSFPLPFTFFALGVFTVISSAIDNKLSYIKWPRILHFVVNTNIIIIAFDFGFRMDDLFQRILFHA
jgi:hypothetical protein